MSYHIKATPYFQRMLATSKRSGELQRLKEEYERIKDFNEKAIETRMRQVRLKRLFQEIEDIKEASLKRRRVQETIAPPKLNFSNEERLNNLSKAKEIGQFFSRRNAMNAAKSGGQDGVPSTNDLQYYRSKAYLHSKRRIRDLQQEEAERAKEVINRRSNYGNEVSNWNMQKMLMNKLHSKVNRGIEEAANLKASTSRPKSLSESSDTSLDGKEKLMYRINYGNTISDMNMILMPKRKTRSNLSKDCLNIKAQLGEDVSSATIRAGTQGCDVYAQSLYSCDPEAIEKSRRARKHWNKLHIVLKYFLNTNQYQYHEQPSTTTSEEDRRYQLRSISNDTNLPHSAMIPDYCQQLELSEPDDELTPNEKVIKTEYYSETTPSDANSGASSTPTDHSTSLFLQQRLKHLPNAQNTYLGKDNNIETFMKLIEPVSMQMVKQEVFETGVKKIKEFFEQKNIA